MELGVSCTFSNTRPPTSFAFASTLTSLYLIFTNGYFSPLATLEALLSLPNLRHFGILLRNSDYALSNYSIARRAEALRCITNHASQFKSFSWRGHRFGEERIELYQHFTSLTSLECELEDAENFEHFDCLNTIQQYTVTMSYQRNPTLQLLLNDGLAGTFPRVNGVNCGSDWFGTLYKLVQSIASLSLGSRPPTLESLLDEVIRGDWDPLTTRGELELLHSLNRHCREGGYYLCAESYTVSYTPIMEKLHLIRSREELTST